LSDKNLQIQDGIGIGQYLLPAGKPRSRRFRDAVARGLDPDNIEILYMAQRVYSDLADDTLNKLAILAPGSARMQQVIAERLINGGDLKGATEHYRKALEIDPHLPGVHYELAEAILESAPGDSRAAGCGGTGTGDRREARWRQR
jgi:tetratricopeptide (TPR) repeat protein